MEARSFTPVKVQACSFKDNFQLAWKWNSKFLLSTLALPKAFENNLFPDCGEILLLQEKESEREKEALQLPKPLQC